MLSEPRERTTRLGCFLVLISVGVTILSFVGAWVVCATIWGWVF